MNILLYGYYGVHNLGDDMILYSLLNIFKHGDFQITILSYGDSYSELLKQFNNVNILIMEKKKIKQYHQIIKSINKTDKLIIGGGGLFPDDRFLYLARMNLLLKYAKKMNKKAIIFAVDIMMLSKLHARYLWKKIMAQIDFIYTRNKSSWNKLHDIGIDNIYSGVDITFSLEDGKKTEQHYEKTVLWALAKPWSDDELNDKHYKKRYDLFCIHICGLIRKIDALGYKNIFVPFFERNDDDLLQKIFDESGKNYEIVRVHDFSYDQRRSVFQKASFVIAMRFHSVLFSVFFGKPFFAISYSPKTTEFMKECNLQNYSEIGIRKKEFFEKEFDLPPDIEDEIINTLENHTMLGERVQKISEVLKRGADKEKTVLLRWALE